MVKEGAYCPPAGFLAADSVPEFDPGLLKPEVLACLRVSSASAAAAALAESSTELLLASDILSLLALTCNKKRRGLGLEVIVCLF